MPVEAGLGYENIEERSHPSPPLPFPPLPSIVPRTQGCFVPAASGSPEALGLISLLVCHLCQGGLSAACPLLTLRLAETCSW